MNSWYWNSLLATPKKPNAILLCDEGPLWRSVTTAATAINMYGGTVYKGNYALCYVNAGNLQVRYSTDGVRWNEATITGGATTSGSQTTIATATVGAEDVWFIHVNAITGYRSVDGGATWTKITLPLGTSTTNRPRYVGDKFYIPMNNKYATSTDATSFTHSATLAGTLYDFGKIGTRLVAIHLNGAYYSDNDGASWNAATVPADWTSGSIFPTSVASSGSKIIGVSSATNGDFFHYTDDGITWYKGSISLWTGGRQTDVVYAYGKFWCYNSGANEIWSTTDGVTWTASTHKPTQGGSYLHTHDNLWMLTPQNVSTSQPSIGECGVEGDANYNYIQLLLHAQGTNGGVIVWDDGPFTRTPTNVGGFTTSTAVVKYGTSSLYTNAGSPLYYPCFSGGGTNLNIGSGNPDFTLETWLYEDTGSLGSICSIRAGASTQGWAWTTSGLRAQLNGVWSDTQMTWTRPSFNTWHHYALSRSGTTLYMHIDGILVATKTGVTTFNSESITNFYFGQSDNASENRLKGYYCDFRHTRGVARYGASNFTPPTVLPDFRT